MQAACERAPLQPNPKNEEMRTTLAMMNATKARLEEEVAAWEGLRGGQPKHDGKMPKVKLSASQEKVLAKAAGVGRRQVPGPVRRLLLPQASHIPAHK